MAETRVEDSGQGPLADLLGAAADGDRDAFAEVYRLTAPKLFGLALNLLRHRERAEEVLQEAFIQVWRHADRYTAERGEPMAWLFGIVRFRALDRLRRDRRAEGLAETAALEAPAAAGASPMDDVLGRDMREAVRNCLGNLEERARDCILLAYYEGFTHAELSARLDAPLGSVKSWIRRGLRTVGRCLETWGYAGT